LEGPLEVIQYNQPPYIVSTLTLEKVAQGLFQLGFEYFQGCKFHSLSK